MSNPLPPSFAPLDSIAGLTFLIAACSASSACFSSSRSSAWAIRSAFETTVNGAGSGTDGSFAGLSNDENAAGGGAGGAKNAATNKYS